MQGRGKRQKAKKKMNGLNGKSGVMAWKLKSVLYVAGKFQRGRRYAGAAWEPWTRNSRGQHRGYGI